MGLAPSTTTTPRHRVEVLTNTNNEQMAAIIGMGLLQHADPTGQMGDQSTAWNGNIVVSMLVHTTTQRTTLAQLADDLMRADQLGGCSIHPQGRSW